MDEFDPGAGALLELEELRAQVAEQAAALDAERERASAAIARLREAFLALEPALEPAMLAGETVEELEASFAAARELLARVREAVQREAAKAVPPGNGLRQGTPPALTPLEKIRAGLARR